MVGQPGPGKAVSMLNARHMFEGEGKTIKATQGGGFRPEQDIPRYVRMWKGGVLNIDGIITARLPLRQVNKGIDLVIAGKASRVLIDMTL
jgi:Zn-dependent alcohol dehydrogenase